MTISNVTPVAGSQILPGDSFGFEVSAGYTLLTVTIDTRGGPEVAYHSGLGGAQGGYTVTVDTTGGDDSFTISRDAGWDLSPVRIDIEEDGVLSEISYELPAEASYPQGSHPYNKSGDQTEHGSLSGLLEDDHPQYLTNARADALYAALGHTHLEADITDLDKYTQAEVDALITGINNDHGGLTGLNDDDHPQYFNQARGDARWAQLAHNHVEADITDLDKYTQAEVDALVQSVAGGLATHIIDGAIHFLQTDIDHDVIQNRGTNTHAQIDTHIADSSVHFTEASIDKYTQAQVDALLLAQDNTQPGEPNGFENANDCTLSFDNGTRTLSLTGTYTFWSNGVKYQRTNDSYVIPDRQGTHFIYYDAAGNLMDIDVFDLSVILQFCFVAYIYWDVAEQRPVPKVLNEQHGSSMSAVTHEYHHETVGTLFESGMVITLEAAADSSGNDDASARFASASGIIWDEDIRHVVLGRANTDNIPVLYKSGATGSWKVNDTRPYPLLNAVGGNNRMAWNEFTGGVWVQTEASNNDFVLVHIYAVPGTNNNDGFLVAVQGQAEYNTLGAARDGALVEITNLETQGLPFSEYKEIATLIYQTGNGYSNVPKARIRSTDAGDDYIDWRFISFAGGGASSSITAAWGNITGDITLQTDLFSAFSASDISNDSDVDGGDVRSALNNLDGRIPDFHDELGGLTDDDHPQYYNQARGDARYAQLVHTHTEAQIIGLDKYTQAEVDTLIAGRAPLAHVHTLANITDAGTAAAEDVGVAVGNVPQLVDVGGGTPGLPAVDGSQLTGLGTGGDVVGPAGATEDYLPSFASDTGKLLKESQVWVRASDGRMYLTGSGPYILMAEHGGAPALSAGFGAYWVKDDAPSSAVFTADDSDEYHLDEHIIQVHGAINMGQTADQWYSWSQSGPAHDSLWNTALGGSGSTPNNSSNWWYNGCFYTTKPIRILEVKIKGSHSTATTTAFQGKLMANRTFNGQTFASTHSTLATWDFNWNSRDGEEITINEATLGTTLVPENYSIFFYYRNDGVTTGDDTNIPVEVSFRYRIAV